VTVDRQDLLKLSNGALNRYRQQQVGFVWQQTGRNLIPYLTALENVQFPMTVAGVHRREKQAWACELLQAVGLYERRHHRLPQLSGGEQQRVSTAVALANKPKLLLGDEPTGEIDSAAAQLVMRTFRRLGEMLNLTTLIVTHDPTIVGQVDRVVAIRDGKTSTETIRRVGQLERAMVGERPTEEDVTYQEYVVLDSAGRLQVPREYLEQFGIGARAQLSVSEHGILIQPTAVSAVVSSSPESDLEQRLGALFTDEPPQKRESLLDRLRRRRK
jgi:putative ABC transport system ATP-binding protein